MARTEKDLGDWELQITYEGDDGKVATSRNKRLRRGAKEVVSLVNTTKDLVLSRGANIIVKDPIDVKNKNISYSVYLVNDIRRNTTSNFVEIWAFGYLRYFELKPNNYLSNFYPEIFENLKKNDETEIINEFYKVVNKDEIFLTCELYELKLIDVVGSANIHTVYDQSDFIEDMDFLLNYACLNDSTNFSKINKEQIDEKLKKLDAKDFNTYLQKITSETNVPKKRSLPKTSTSNSKNRKLPSRKKKASSSTSDNNKKPQKKIAKNERVIDLLAEPSDNESEIDSDLESDSESDSEKDDNEDGEYNDDTNHGDSDNNDDDDEGEAEDISNLDNSNLDDLNDNGGTEDEDIVDDDDSDDGGYSRSTRDRKITRNSNNMNLSSRRLLRSGLDESKILADSQQPHRLFQETRYTPKAHLIRKFTKRNVNRAKKKYTPFSKRYKDIESIPDLKNLSEFNSFNTDLQILQLEDRLKAPTEFKVVETLFSKIKKQLNSTHSKEAIIKNKDFNEIIPGRENEFASIYLSLYSALQSKSAITLYIAGTPGVGKTLTVREVIKELYSSRLQGELPDFQYVEINGLKMIKPTSSYEVLWNKISSEQLTWGAAMESLEFFFKEVPKEKKKPVVVLLDELDSLVTKAQDIMYNFFNWTTHPNSQLIVIAIANTMDLPEKELGNKVSSRIGFTRIMFTGYTHEELKTIINFRLKGLNNSSFYVNMKTGEAQIIQDDNNDDGIKIENLGHIKRVKLRMSDDAIEIASRKVASVSGDARRALKICKRAAEIAEKHYMVKHGFGYDGERILEEAAADPEEQKIEKDEIEDGVEVQTVRIFHVMKALNEIINSISAQFILGCSFTTKLFLYSFLNQIRKTKQQEQSLGNIIDEIELVMTVNNVKAHMSQLVKPLFHLNSDSKDNVPEVRVLSWDESIRTLVDAGIISKHTMANERTCSVKFLISAAEVARALDQDPIWGNL